MLHIIDQRHVDHVQKPLPIANGGTGAKTPELALAALSGVAATHIAEAGGPVPLDSNAMLPDNNLPEITPENINYCSVMGPSVLYNGKLTTFWITDYDSNKSYSVSVSIGTVHIDGEWIDISIPFSTTIGQICILNVNDNEYALPIAESYITSINTLIYNTPFASQKQVNAEFQSIGGYPIGTIQIKQELSFSNTFDAIERTITFPNITSDEFQRYSWSDVIDGLIGSSTYYYRIRLEVVDDLDNVLFNSAWLNNSFTTEAIVPTYVDRYIADYEFNYQTSMYGQGSHKLSMSNTGNLLSTTMLYQNQYPGHDLHDLTNVSIETGSYYMTLNGITDPVINPTGIVSVVSGNGEYVWYGLQQGIDAGLDYQRSKRNIVDNSFNYDASIFVFGTNNVSTYGALGRVCTNNNGSVLCHYQLPPTHLSNGSGAVYAHFLIQDANGVVGNSYQQILIQADNEPTLTFNPNDFGRALAMSDSGNRLVVSAISTQFPSGKIGAVYVFTRVGNAYILEQRLEASNVGFVFGHDVTISDDGLVIAVSEVYEPDGTTLTNGRVTIFKFNGTTWVQDDVLSISSATPAGLYGDSGFGFSIKLNGLGNILAVGAPYAQKVVNNIPSTEKTGAVHAYEFENNVWMLKKTLYDSDVLNGAELGRSVEINSDGTIIAATSPKTDVTSATFINPQTAPNIVIFR